jgi:hypothetical protein
MGKSKSCKTEEKCLLLSPNNAYESLRMARIAKNQACMAELGVQKQAGDLKAFFKVTKSPCKYKIGSTQKSVLEYTPIRRSEHLKRRTPSTPNNESKSLQPPSLDTKTKSLFESDDEKSPKSNRNLARYNCEENGGKKTGNAPLPKCSPAALQLSPDLLAQRYNSKSRGSIYKSILGICCHFCRQKRLCGEENCERCGDRDVTKACLGIFTFSPFMIIS